MLLNGSLTIPRHTMSNRQSGHVLLTSQQWLSRHKGYTSKLLSCFWDLFFSAHRGGDHKISIILNILNSRSKWYIFMCFDVKISASCLVLWIGLKDRVSSERQIYSYWNDMSSLVRYCLWVAVICDKVRPVYTMCTTIFRLHIIDCFIVIIP